MKLQTASWICCLLFPFADVSTAASAPQLPGNQNSGASRTTLRPTTSVVVSGILGKELDIQMGAQNFKLHPQEKKRMILPNGSEIELVHDAAAQTLGWRIAKGRFVFDLSEIGCARVVGLADQAAALRWNTREMALDIENLSSPDLRVPDRNIVLSLANGIAASVGARASFHYFPDDRCRRFTAQARGGAMELFNLSMADELALRGIAGPEPSVAGSADHAGWRVNLPEDCQVDCRVNPVKQLIDVRTPLDNGRMVRWTIGDGARAELGGGSTARLDLFADGTYALIGSGSISAVNEDGQEISLSGSQAPMTGGPLVRVTDGKGAARMERRLPTTAVNIAGNNGEDLTLQIGDQTIKLAAGGQQTVTLPNGSVLRLEQNPKTDTFNWQVEKGDFRLALDFLAGWKALGLTEQSATVTWDRVGKAVDLSNRTAVWPVIVALPSQTFARVAPGATFQFAQINSATFAASASGGAVTIYNAGTGQMTDLAQGNLSFKWGIAASSGKNNAPKNAVSLEWHKGSPLLISGSAGGATVPPNSEKILQGNNGSQLQINYGSQGEIVLKALVGDYTIRLQPLQSLAVELPEGNVFSLELDERKGFFLGRAGPENSSPVNIVTAEGSRFSLNAGKSFTLIGQSVGPTALLQGDMVFFESAGAPGGNEAFGIAPTASPFTGTVPLGQHYNQLDVSRISQPPVSVVR